MELSELLEGLDASVVSTVTEHLNAKAKEKGAKVLVSDKENSYVPQYRLDEVVAEREKQKAANKELNDSISQLQAELKDNESAQTIVANLQAQVEASEKIIRDTKVREEIRNVFDNAEFGFKAVAPVEDILALLDNESIHVGADGSVSGVKDQVSKLTETKAYMFEKKADPNDKPKPPAGTGFFPKPKGGNAEFQEGETGSLGALLAKSVKPANEGEQFSYFKD